MNGNGDPLPLDLEGRIGVAVLATWVAIASLPGSIFSGQLNESQQPITIAAGLTTLLALVGIAAHFVDSRAGGQLGRIGLVAAQFGLVLAALGVVEFVLLPTDPGSQQVGLSIGLLLVLVAAFAFTAGIGVPRLGGAPVRPARASTAVVTRRGGVTGPMFLTLVGTLLVAAAIGFIGLANLDASIFEGLETVVLLVAGFVTVTLLLYIGSVLLQTLGLGNRREALGMPEGSIRALIALSLILIFAIIGVAVFQAGGQGSTFESTNISQEQVDALDADEILRIERVEPVDGEERFNVTSRASLPPTAKDFGLQLLTTVSTLVVAVAGFYFGAKSVAQATKAVRASDTEASLALVSPTQDAVLTQSGDPPAWDPVPITLAVRPTFVDLAPTIKGDPTGRVERTGVGSYRYIPGEPGPVVVITFTLPPPYAGSQQVTLTAL